MIKLPLFGGWHSRSAVVLACAYTCIMSWSQMADGVSTFATMVNVLGVALYGTSMRARCQSMRFDSKFTYSHP